MTFKTKLSTAAAAAVVVGLTFAIVAGPAQAGTRVVERTPSSDASRLFLGALILGALGFWVATSSGGSDSLSLSTKDEGDLGDAMDVSRGGTTKTDF